MNELYQEGQTVLDRCVSYAMVITLITLTILIIIPAAIVGMTKELRELFSWVGKDIKSLVTKGHRNYEV